MVHLDTVITSVDEACDALANDSFIALDLETSSLNPFSGRLEVVSMHGLESGATAVLHTGFRYSQTPDPRLAHFFENHDAVFVGHNLTTFDLPYMFTHGYDVTKMTFVDTYICEQILTMVEGIVFDNSLQSALKRRLNIPVGKDNQGHHWTTMMLTGKQMRYCVEDVVHLIDLYFEQNNLINAYGLQNVWGIEYQMCKILLDMSVRGISLDEDIYMQHFEDNKAFVDECIENLTRLAGKPLNWNSHKQIKELFADMGHRLDSTREEALTDAATWIGGTGGEILKELLRYKERAQLVKTYKKDWWAENTFGGKSHPTFNQMGASTGRMSCSNPNFQQIPQVMRNFICGDQWLVSVDYSQLELRVHAGIWAEQSIIDIFRNGGDVHKEVASRVFETPFDDVSSDQRQVAKSIAFLVVFGGGAKALQRTMRKNQQLIEMSYAKKVIDDFYREMQMFKAAKDWAVGISDSGLLEFMVEMPYGYKRLIRATKQKDFNGVERTMIKPTLLLNTPTQGTASIIMKNALLEVAKTPMINHLSNVIHDEIVLARFQSEQEALDRGNELAEIMKASFYDIYPEVPCVAEVSVGQHWSK